MNRSVIPSVVVLLMTNFAILQGVSVSNQEIKDIGNALWEQDRRINNVEFHVQGLLKSNESQSTKDVAPNSLFAPIPDEDLKSSVTVQNFLKLLDNYDSNVRNTEHFTQEQEQEIAEFVNSVIDTEVMATAWKFLVSKNFASPDKDEFAKQLKTIWFELYSKAKRVNCSSGFEHVFLGETKGAKTSGFHNWIRFYTEEMAGNMDYDGYYLHENYNEGSMLKLKFTWNKHLKPISSFFIRTTPEFEMAIYTICFYSRPKSTCKLSLNNRTLPIFSTYKIERGVKYLLTAYPQK